MKGMKVVVKLILPGRCRALDIWGTLDAYLLFVQSVTTCHVPELANENKGPFYRLSNMLLSVCKNPSFHSSRLKVQKTRQFNSSLVIRGVRHGHDFLSLSRC